jgi:hypothetical protein
MTSTSKLLRVFTVCAGVAAYFYLQKNVPDPNASAEWPDKQVQKDLDNPHAGVFPKEFLDRFVNQYCLFSPDEKVPNDVSKMVRICLEEKHHTESGDFLIRDFLRREYEKGKGLAPKPKPCLDPESFPFLG